MSKKQVAPVCGMSGDEGFVEGFAVDVAWQTAWARAVVKAWEEPAFKSRLLSGDAEEVRGALAEFGFIVPEGVALNIVDFQGNESYQLSSNQNGWAHFADKLAPKVEMVLPPEPKDDKAAAIVDYMATGKSYPFSTI